ncbi:MAG: hypothetical protein ACREUG_12355 [Steroidobacteraceae bacterium]
MNTWTPSGATSASLAGGYLATVLIAVLTQYHVLSIDPTLAAAITGLCCIGLSYLHPLGRLSIPTAPVNPANPHP